MTSGPAAEHGRILRDARLDDRAITWNVVRSSLQLACGIVTIPLLIVWIPAARVWFGLAHRALSCSLAERALLVRRGVLVRQERNIPLDKITDLGLYQGPLMRRFGLEGITVETAGQSGGAGALVNLVGIVETRAFRDAVLAQRDRLAEHARDDDGADTPAERELLAEIRDALLRVEARLGDQ